MVRFGFRVNWDKVVISTLRCQQRCASELHNVIILLEDIHQEINGILAFHMIHRI